MLETGASWDVGLVSTCHAGEEIPWDRDLKDVVACTDDRTHSRSDRRRTNCRHRARQGSGPAGGARAGRPHLSPRNVSDVSVRCVPSHVDPRQLDGHARPAVSRIDRRRDERQWADRGPRPEAPVFRHVITTDATTEALAPMLLASKGLLALQGRADRLGARHGPVPQRRQGRGPAALPEHVVAELDQGRPQVERASRSSCRGRCCPCSAGSSRTCCRTWRTRPSARTASSTGCSGASRTPSPIVGRSMASTRRPCRPWSACSTISRPWSPTETRTASRSRG